MFLLDGHVSLIKLMSNLDSRRQHEVHILSFPPHCTHRLQHLDVCFMKSLSTYYMEATNKLLRESSGRVITQFQITELVGEAFQKAATLTNGCNSYQATGFWRLNHDIFRGQTLQLLQLN